jgi:hypothetical protein
LNSVQSSGGQISRYHIPRPKSTASSLDKSTFRFLLVADEGDAEAQSELGRFLCERKVAPQDCIWCDFKSISKIMDLRFLIFRDVNCVLHITCLPFSYHMTLLEKTKENLDELTLDCIEKRTNKSENIILF